MIWERTRESSDVCRDMDQEPSGPVGGTWASSCTGKGPPLAPAHNPQLSHL